MCKRRETRFRQNHSLGGKREYSDIRTISKWLPRQPEDAFRKLVKEQGGLYTVPDVHNKSGTAKILRPSAGPTFPLPDPEVSSDSLITDRQMLLKCLNGIITEHSKSNVCTNVNIIYKKEIKKGCSARISFGCSGCSFVSSMFPLYKAVDKPGPGAKQAAVNLGLQAGLQETAIGNFKLRVLLSGGSVYSPAASGMQTTANRVASETTTLNKRDMVARLKDLRQINRQRGVEDPNEFNCCFDGRYDSPTLAVRHKMGQSCSQGTGVLRETTTSTNQIVGLSLLNKLCWTGQYLKHRGFNVKCPGGHDGCTANMQPSDNISERKMANNIGQDIESEGMVVKYMVTDGDSTSVEGMADAFLKGTKVIKQADPVHRGQTIIRYAQKASFSKGMFPPPVKKITAAEMKKHLAIDIKNRSSLVMKGLFSKYNGDTDKIATKLIPTVDSIIACYNGNCTRCRYQMTGCGGGKWNSWWARSQNLNALKWTSGSINMTTGDKLLMRSLLELKLSASALSEMRMQQTSNPAEAFNRALSARLPKNVTYSRNAEGRVHATAHSLNNKIGHSIIQKVHHLGTEVGPQSTRTLQQIEKRVDYFTEYKKTHKAQLLSNRKLQIKNYVSKKRDDSSNEEEDSYKKGRQEPAPKPPMAPKPPAPKPAAAPTPTAPKPEHNYSVNNTKKKAAVKNPSAALLTR